jgi:hypothetical protein
MREETAKLELRWKTCASAICATLVLFAVLAQSVHVHAQAETSGAICPACVSAHTGTPVSPIVSSFSLFAIASVLVLPELEIPSCEAVLPLFIRPPPSR